MAEHVVCCEVFEVAPTYSLDASLIHKVPGIVLTWPMFYVKQLRKESCSLVTQMVTDSLSRSVLPDGLTFHCQPTQQLKTIGTVSCKLANCALVAINS